MSVKLTPYGYKNLVHKVEFLRVITPTEELPSYEDLIGLIIEMNESIRKCLVSGGRVSYEKSTTALNEIKDSTNRKLEHMGWNQMEYAPKDREIEVFDTHCMIDSAHYTHNTDGGEQTPFSGWYRKLSENSYGAISPIMWREKLTR